MNNLQDLKENIEHHNIITFDVFDTLILRDVDKPKNVFRLVEKLYNEKYGINSQFYKNRIKAEKKARRVYPYKEVSFYEIYRVLLDKYSAQECDELSKLELFVEAKVCTVNYEIKKYYEYALGLGKEIFIITDMYLPRKFIREILEQNGYTGFQDILVSGEYHKTKSDGTLFKMFLDKYHFVGEQVLHIGDNIQADYNKAKKNGIKAFLYKNSQDYITHCVPNLIDKHMYREYANLCAFIKNHIQRRTDSYFYTCGYSLFGPLILGYIKWLIDKCEKARIDKILFASRDGYILQKAYNIVLEKKIDNVYFYTSRKAIITALLHYDNSLREVVMRYKSWPYKFSFALFLTKVGISPKEADKLGCIEFNTEFTVDEFIDNSLIQQQFFKIKPLIDKKSIEEEECLLSYIKELQIKNKKVALVDLGGRQTIAKNLRELLKLNNIHIDLYGCYLEIQDKVTQKADGYLFSYGKNKRIYNTLSSYYYFLEIILSAPHGSVRGYRRDKERIYPIYEKYDYKESDKEPKIIKSLQAGTLDFCQDIKKEIKLYDFKANIAIKNLRHFGLMPNEMDRLHWKDFMFNADVLTVLIPHIDRLQLMAKPKALIYDYKSSLWKAGYIASILNTAKFNYVFELGKVIVKSVLNKK